jgi:hypothetical protein
MLVSLFFDLKEMLTTTLHLSRDALHVHIGLIIFLSGAMLLRGPRRFQMAFLGLLALCLAGEVADIVGALGHVRGPNWLGGAKDIVNTMFWPGLWLMAWPQVARMLRSGEATPVMEEGRGTPQGLL